MLCQVRHGRAWALYYFEANYSQALEQRILLKTNATKEIVAESAIHLYQDNTQEQISLEIQQATYG